MKREAVFCSVLVVLLLVSVFHMANLQLPGVNGAGSDQKIDDMQPRTIEHRITGSELQLLKSRIGVRQEGQNYNQTVDGHGTGLAPPSEADWEKIGKEAYVVDQVLSTASLPSNVDNSATPWFPPIGNQLSQGSCVAWAVGYYTKTFQEAKEHNWSLSGTTPNEIMSPSFIYNLINNGVDQGSNFYNAIQLVCSVGDCSLAKMPYNSADCTSWPSEEAWREAALYRGNYSGYEGLQLTTDAGLASLRNWILSGNLAVIAVDGYQFAYLSSNDVWTVSNYVNPSTNHANTIVGYDDNFQYIEEGQLRQGAFKIANSWGVGGWEKVPDGFYWISYKAMEQRVQYCMFYRDRIGYVPTLTCSFEIEHPLRGECSIVIGMGTHDNPTVSKSFTDYIHGGNQPFCSNNIVLDITEFEDAVPNVYGKPFFLSVYDGGSPATGTIFYFSVENTVSSNTPVTTVNGGYVFADLTLEGTIYIRADGSVDPPTAPISTSDNVTYTFTGNIVNESIVIQRDNIVLDGAGYTVQGTGASNAGIDLSGRENVTVKNTQIKSFYYGILLNSSSSNNVSGNNITANNYYGIYLASSSNDNSMFRNNITNNSYGIAFNNFCSNNSIDDNGMANNYNGGVWLSGSCNYDSISGNTITNNSMCLDWSSSNNTIYGNAMTNSSILVYRSQGNNIYGNTITNNGATSYGIELVASSHNTIYGNMITTNMGEGIYLHAARIVMGVYDFSSYNNIYGNNITTNGGDGIEFAGSSSNDVYRNSMTVNNGDAVYLHSTNVYQGWFVNSLDNSLFENNVVATNQYCVRLENSSSGNFIYHNNFSGMHYVYSEDSTNVWDSGYPSGGNYWKDYTDVDSFRGPNQNVPGSDGIWDHSYVIDENNTDRYPLVNPWVPMESLVVRGMDSRIYYRVWNGTGWHGWNVLPGSTVDSPAAAMLGNQLNIVVRGSDGNSLWYGYLTNVSDPSSFSGWTLLSGATSSAPTLTSNGTTLCLVVRGLDNRIYYRVYDTGAQAWQGWNALPSGTTCDKPAAAMLGSTLSIVVRGYSPTDASANNTLWYSTVNLTNNAFSGWTMLSGATPSSPALTASQTFNSQYLTVRGNDNRIYVNTWNGGNWQGWNALPTGATNKTPATTIMGDKLFFVVIGMDGASMWQSSLDLTTSNFSGWTLLSGATPSAPTLTS